MSRDIRRHVTAAGIGITIVGVVFLALGQTPELWRELSYGPKAEDTHWKLSVAMASAASVLLAITLTIGPVRVLLGRPPSVHLPVRRTFGVWTAGFALGHLVLGATFHTVGIKVWTPFTVGLDSSGALKFTAAVWLGLFAAILLGGLALISRSVWLQRLGAKRWKAMQRLSYAAAAAVLSHMLLVQRHERRLSRHIAIALIPFAVVAVLQFAAFVRVRSSKSDDSAAMSPIG